MDARKAKSSWKKMIRMGERIVAIIGTGVVMAAIVAGAYMLAYEGKVVAGVRVAGVGIGNKTGEEAAALVERAAKERLQTVRVAVDGKEWWFEPEALGVKIDLPASVNKAWLVAREGGWGKRVEEAYRGLTKGVELTAEIVYDEEKLNVVVAEVATGVERVAVLPSVDIEGEKERRVVVERGSNGVDIDEEALRVAVIERWKRLSEEEVVVEKRTIVAEIDEATAERVRQEGERWKGKTLKLRADGEDWEWGEEDLVRLVRVDGERGLNKEKVRKAVVELATAVNREPQNATFRFEEGRVKEFQPGKAGLTVKEEETAGVILAAADRWEEEEEIKVEVVLEREEPAVATQDVNDLGIEELLGRGKSTFFHSIPNRVHNINLAASRLAGVVVPPGEVFSFNKALGEVSGATGYKAAYVISGGRTVLGDGGGVCQVSTTLFRAALGAGLPIVERRAHAYRVGYYEQDSEPGIDATVYAPTVDLKFKNDTTAYLLIQPVIDVDNFSLAFEIYGRSDGREAKISKVKVWGQSPPPPTIYQDDPTLPVGVLRQVDWSAWGAKTSFDYRVEREGEVVFEKTFTSAYRPWQAIFLRGTKTN